MRVVVRSVEFIPFSECHLAETAMDRIGGSKERDTYFREDKQARVFRRRCIAIIRALAAHIGEVETLAEHVPSLDHTFVSYDGSSDMRRLLTTGASGGAIRSPWLIIPAKFVKRDPCLRNRNAPMGVDR